MKSIRLFLIAGILATLTLFNFIAALRGYQSSMSEADVLFDNQLLDISQLVARLEVNSISRDFRLGNNLAFQIWENESLLAASYHAPETPITEMGPGFSFANFDGYRWRTYTRLFPEQHRKIIVAERTDLRFILAENVVLESILPILLSIPLIGFFIWLVVSRGLLPLKELSTHLRNKQVQDLSPIPENNTRQELRQVVHSINAFIQRLRAGMEREKRFSADAAHELRTPISAIKVDIHNLLEELNNKGVDINTDSFRNLEDGVERMQHLVEQLLALYRLSPEALSQSGQLVDLYSMVQEVVAENYTVIEDKHQNLELVGHPCMVKGDEFAIKTLVANLLLNANKYTQQGGEIKLSVASIAGQAEFMIEDNGPGIPDEDKNRIFERFFRSSHDNEGLDIPGCGLGLTIVHQIAELHNASVTLEDSGFATGCAFKVCFPIQEVEQ